VPHLTSKSNKKQNNSFAIMLLFNNMSLSYPRPPCEPFTPPSLTIQGLTFLSDTSGHRRNFVKSEVGRSSFNLWELESSYLRSSQILKVTDLTRHNHVLTNILLPEMPGRHPTCRASSQWSHTISRTMCHGAWTSVPLSAHPSIEFRCTAPQIKTPICTRRTTAHQ